MVITFLFLAACQEGGQSVSPRVAGAKAADETLALPRVELTDEQKLSIVNPLTLDSYKNNLEKIFSKLETDSQISWASLFNTRTWLVLPLNKAKNIKSVVSNSYSDTVIKENVIIALQSQHEVWIDKDNFEKMNDADKAKVLLGEYLKAIYTNKNLSNENICLMASEIFSKDDCDSSEWSNSLSTSALTQSEYDSINQVRDYILQQADKISAAELVKKMDDAGFDMRILDLLSKDVKTTKGDSEAASVEKFDILDTTDIYKQLAALSGGKSQCSFLHSKDSSDCNVTSQLQTVNEPGKTKPYAFLRFSAQVGETAVLSETVYKLDKISAEVLTTSAEARILLLPLMSQGVLLKEQGTKYRTNYALVKSTQDVLTVEGFISVPSVITEVVGTKEGDQVTCKGTLDKFTASNVATDIIVVSKNQEVLNLVSSRILSLNPSVAPCW